MIATKKKLLCRIATSKKTGSGRPISRERRPLMELNEYVGKEVRDKVTKRVGVCTGIVHWLYGCHHARVVFKATPSEMLFYDSSSLLDSMPMDRLEIVGSQLDASTFKIDQELEEKLMGKEVRDKISNFEGIVTGIAYDLYNDAVANVTSRVDGEKNTPIIRSMDAGRLEVIGDGLMPEEVQREDTEKTGGDTMSPLDYKFAEAI